MAKPRQLDSFLNWSWKVGKLFGIPIYLHITILFFLYPAFVWAKTLPFWYGLEFGVLMVVSILFHELGHALVAKKLKFTGLSITLHGFGGFAMSSGYRTPKQALAIVLAGPAVTLITGIVCYYAGMGLLTQTGNPAIYFQGSILWSLGIINLWMAVINMIPTLPWDGGLATLALIRFKKSDLIAHRITGHIGIVVCSILVVLALYLKFALWVFIAIGILASYNAIKATGGFKFKDMAADRKAKKELEVVKAKEKAKSDAYVVDVKDRIRERDEQERLRRLLDMDDN